MKARKIIIKDKYLDEQTEHIFKHYENAVKFRMRMRSSDMKLGHSENRFGRYWNSKKIGPIKEIEVADDYWKKDFGKYLSIGYMFGIGKKPKNTGRQDYTETEHLSHILYRIHHNIRTSHELDRNSEDVKFMLEDLQRYNETSLPKNVEVEQKKELFFSCWKILEKLGYERYISEKDRGMYEDEYKEYCERMDAMQKELNDFISNK